MSQLASPTSRPQSVLATDHSLLRRLHDGEQDAATDLYHRYASRLWTLANNQIGQKLGQRLEADDVVQSVFRTFFRRAVAGKYDVPAGDEIWGLFLVIGLNKVRAAAVRHSAEKRDVSRTESLSSTHAEIAGTADNTAVLQQVISELLTNLPTVQQQIVTLRVEGFSTAEIAAAVSRSKRTVERVLQQFRKRLSKETEGDA